MTRAYQVVLLQELRGNVRGKLHPGVAESIGIGGVEAGG